MERVFETYHADPAIKKGGPCMANGNKEYRSDVFSMLLQDKRRALEIYNAINETVYDDPEQVEFTTLGAGCFSLSIRNDASFIFDAKLSIYEHQSTYCPNMPLRDLIYFTSIVRKYVNEQKKDLFGKTLVKIPAPHFIVFYNGTQNAPEYYDLRLPDAFEQKTDTPQLELVCQVYNINNGNNAELLSKCPTLYDYMYFIDLVREYYSQNNYEDLEEAIDQAISQCIRENVLKDFFTKRREEVTRVMTLDFTFERRLELQREEATEEGRELKLQEQIRKKLLKNKTSEQIADELEEPLEVILPLCDQIEKELHSTT